MPDSVPERPQSAHSQPAQPDAANPADADAILPDPPEQAVVRLPAYVRIAVVLHLLALLLLMLVLGRSLFIPLLLGVLLSFLLVPVSSRLEQWRVPRGLAIVLSIVLATVVIAGVGTFLATQIAGFSQDMPELEQRLSTRWAAIQDWVATTFGVEPAQQIAFLRARLSELGAQGAALAMGVFNATTSVVVAVGLLPIYIFFLTYYREKFQHFLQLLVRHQYHDKVHLITTRISRVTAKYLAGLLVDIAILSVLNSIGYSLLGVPHAILLGILAAMLNIIPYIGTTIGSVLPILMVLVTKDSAWYAVGTLGVALGVQFLDNNFIMPLVVGRSVNLNPLATIIALFVGGLVWGVVGMILFVPLMGMLKIAFDHIEALRPWGYLIGQEDEPERPVTQRVRGLLARRTRPRRT